MNDTTLELAADSMLGNLIAVCLDEIKAAPDVWPKLNEHQQGDVIDRVRRQIETAIRQAVHLIAADGREVIAADLEQITAKDDIKAVLKLARHDERRHALLDAVGKPVLIVVAGNSQFLGGEIPAPEPNQADLDIPVGDNGRATAVSA